MDENITSCAGGGDKSKAYLVSFGDTRLGISICRFKQQAETLGVFDNVFIYTEASLPLDFIKDFESKFYTYKSGIKTPTRGFGYWSWKPKVILMALEQINFGDYLIYCDIGFEFNAKAKSELEEFFSDIQTQDILGVISHHKEKYWNKADLLAHFNLLEDESFLDSGQVVSGLVFMKKCEKTLKIIEEWLAYFYHSYPLIDDSPSKIPNLKEFKENRHDQSIWSILNKRYKLKNYDYADFFNQNRCLLYNRNKIYLPAIAEETKALNEAIRGVNRYNFQWNLQAYQKNLEEYAKGIYRDERLEFKANFGVAVDRVHNHLAYKLGNAMILNSKNLWGYIRMPYVLSYIKAQHKIEQEKYQKAIAKNPKLKFPKLESYADYKEALREKQCLTYKLGEAFIRAYKNFWRGGLLKFYFFDVRRFRKEFLAKKK